MLIDVQKQIVGTLTEEVKTFLQRVFPDSYESAISALADQLGSGPKRVASSPGKRSARWSEASRLAAGARMKKLWADRRKTKASKKPKSKKTRKVSKKRAAKVAIVQTQAA